MSKYVYSVSAQTLEESIPKVTKLAVEHGGVHLRTHRAPSVKPALLPRPILQFESHRDAERFAEAFKESGLSLYGGTANPLTPPVGRTLKRHLPIYETPYRDIHSRTKEDAMLQAISVAQELLNEEWVTLSDIAASSRHIDYPTTSHWGSFSFTDRMMQIIKRLESEGKVQAQKRNNVWYVTAPTKGKD